MSEDRNPAAPGPIRVPANRAPRVWPVFVAFGADIVANMFGGGVLLVTMVILDHGAMPPADELDALVQSIALSGPMLIGGVALSVLILSSISFLGSLLSPLRVRDRLRLRWPSVSLLVYPTCFLGIVSIGQLTEYAAGYLGVLDGTTGIEELNNGVRDMTASAFMIFLALASLGAGCAEELFFRGYIQTRLEKRWGVWAAIGVTSIGFGILHFDPVHSSMAFFMGLYLGWLAARTQSIVLPMVAHVSNNLVALAMLRLFETELEPSVIGVVVCVALAVGSIVLLTRLLPAPAKAPAPSSG